VKIKGVVFPGQGAQRQNMGVDFVEAYPEAAKIFDIASQSLGIDLLEINKGNSHTQTLSSTVYAQPCIVVTEIAMYEVLKMQPDLAFAPEFFAGHSLGEYSALVAANVISLETAAQILYNVRGRLMQDAMENSDGAMAAVIIKDLPYAEIKQITNKHDIDIANHNSLDQVVISGLANDVDLAIADLKMQYEASVRCVLLDVDSAFHSRHMQSIGETFHQRMLEYKKEFNPKNLPKVLSNYTGDFYTADVDQLIDLLSKQLYSEVKWQSNMQNMLENVDGIVDGILELGPNRPLSGFFKTMGVRIQNVCNLRGLKKLKGE